MNKRAAIVITRAMVTDSFLRGQLGRDDVDKINEMLDADDEPDAPQWEGVLKISILIASSFCMGLLFGMIIWLVLW